MIWSILCAAALVAASDTDDACAVEQQRGAAKIRAVRHGRVADRAEAIISKRVVTAYK